VGVSVELPSPATDESIGDADTARPPSPAAISVRSLSKSYGNRRVVVDVSFDVGTGVTALLGPNGAGKTTILRCLTGLLPWNQGTIEIDGVDVLSNPLAARRRIGYLPERVAFPPELRVRSYLDYVARSKGVARGLRRAEVDRALERTDLTAVADRLVNNLSKGFRQRVGLAQATIGEPPVLVLDEPLAGVDPLHVWDFRDVLWEYGRDHAVVLSTHVLPEARVLSDRVLVVVGGRVAFDGSLVDAELSSVVTSRWRLGVAGGSPEAVDALLARAGVTVIHRTESGSSVNLVIDAAAAGSIDAVVHGVVAAGWRLAHVEPMTDLIEAALRSNASAAPREDHA
jgi:ABC-2 type transport system ATP-binding protein